MMEPPVGAGIRRTGGAVAARPPRRRHSYPQRPRWTAASTRMLERLDALRRDPWRRTRLA